MRLFHTPFHTPFHMPFSYGFFIRLLCLHRRSLVYTQKNLLCIHEIPRACTTLSQGPGTQKGRWAGPRPWTAPFLGPWPLQECCACTRDHLCIHKRFFCVYTRDLLCRHKNLLCEHKKSLVQTCPKYKIRTSFSTFTITLNLEH